MLIVNSVGSAIGRLREFQGVSTRIQSSRQLMLRFAKQLGSNQMSNVVVPTYRLRAC